MEATREIFWNISGHIMVYLLFIIAGAICAYGFFERYKLWRLGQPVNRNDQLGKRIKSLVDFILGHKIILRQKLPGISHFLIFFGMVILGIGTTIVAIQADLGLNIMRGKLYLYFISLALDLAGLGLLVGLVAAAYRRYVQKAQGLDNQSTDGITLGLIIGIVVTGFLIEGIRITATVDPWAVWSPVGNTIASIISGAGLEGLKMSHQIIWWTHLIVSMGFIAYLPYSKLIHTITTPLNTYFRSLEAKGALVPLDLENEEIESFGVAKLEDFTWKDLLDTDACIRCGRCQNNCPASLTGKSLSPKGLIQDLKTHLNTKGTAILEAQSAMKKHGVYGKEVAASSEIVEEINLIKDVVKEDALWSCTTCRSCMEQCPAFVEHVPKVVDMRRNQVLMESEFPAELNLAFKNMENNSNPWGLGWAKRADWAEGLDIKLASEVGTPEYLYWVGCAGAFDNRNKKVAIATAELLKAAGVNFAILGTEEKCCGDSARRLGNEYLYQSLAQENIELLNNYGIKKIITHCPHCFNTLKNEYPQFDGNFEVIHHTEVLADLISSKQLKLNHKKNESVTITYHDSCYLGRYNDLYQPPREILKNLGFKLKEMPRSFRESFCCGAGGGRMWMEEHGERINVKRTEEALELKTQLIGTGCPFCLTMLEDGTKIKDVAEDVKVMDVAELIQKAL